MASLLNGLELAEGRKLVCALTKTEKKRFRFIVAMEYNLWKDVDIELYSSGGDEAVKDWKGSFNNTGIQAWRITDDNVEEWCLAKEGKFFSEEVYIVLNCTYLKTSATTAYDIHCWIGKQASSKLYKRGLYNAIALDDAMDGKALVHREVQDYESKRFTNYFDAFTVLKGKSDEMVNCDLSSAYKDRLLRVSRPTAGGKICVRETALKRGALVSNDTFIIDRGTKIYQWFGMLTDKDQSEKGLRYRVNEYVKQMKMDRKETGITVKIVDEGEKTKHDSLYDVFPNVAKKRKPSRQESVVFLGQKKMMFKVSVKSNPQVELEFIPVAEGADVCSSKMKSSEVNIVDVRFGKRDAEDHLFIRIGDDWSGDKKSGLIYGHHYLKQCSELDQHPTIAITVVKEDQLSTQLNSAINS